MINACTHFSLLYSVDVLVRPSSGQILVTLPHVSRSLDVLLKPGKEGTLDDAGQYTVVHAHMEHLAASSVNADIAGRAKKVSINYGAPGEENTPM